jgi:hypothetical protein
VLLLTIGSAAQQRRFDGKTLWHHVEILATDDMEGRRTGTPGLERAEAYVIDQLRKSGLSPAGVDGFFQPVKLTLRAVAEQECRVALVRDGHIEPLVLGEDAVLTTFVDAAPSVDAPLVFLGYGVQVPERGYDDLAGLDLRGKIAVTMTGVPEGIFGSGPLANHYMSEPVRWKQYSEAGLIGWIQIPAAAVSWPGLIGSMSPWSLDGDEFDEAKGQQIHMFFNPRHADKLFEGTGHTPSELADLGRAHKPLPRFPLPVRIRAKTCTVDTPVASANVVGKLEGSDPRLRNEYVVLSAHIDGQGVRAPVNGDPIRNGAIDNASGVAALLGIADALKREGTRPRRSVLFAFFTAEEGGRHGSEYFVAHPPVDRKSLVANINIDVVLAIAPLEAVFVDGAEESDLGDAARRAAATQHVALYNDPSLTGRFADGSDQSSFVRGGIPAVRLRVGFPGELKAAQEKWLRERYHTPFDDLQQPINLETVARYEEIAYALLLDVANNPRRPAWKSSSFYQRYVR